MQHINMFKINYILQITNKLDNHCLITSSVASPVCQEGKNERTFPIFAFSSRFFLFFSRYFLIFSSFFRFLAHFSLSGVALCSPWPPVATPLLITLIVLLWVMQSYHTSPVRCIISLAGINIPFIKYQKSHKSDQLGM